MMDATISYELTPRDVLFFRDARPMDTQKRQRATLRMVVYSLAGGEKIIKWMRMGRGQGRGRFCRRGRSGRRWRFCPARRR